MNTKTYQKSLVGHININIERYVSAINDLVAASCVASASKGWHDDHATVCGGNVTFDLDEARRKAAEKIALCHSELSEALECLRNNEPDFYTGENGKPEGVAPELADAVIRIFDLCGMLGLDLGSAIIDKMAHNATRPHRHGGKAF